MPAIQVARTDTFETQRVKINEIGSQVFSITQGGSDLATGNLKLGDGTRTAPSLAFTSDASLGIFKPDVSTIGYVASGKKLVDFSPTGIFSFRDFYIQKKVLSTSGLSVLNFGSGYDTGSYTGISLTGGTGDGAEISVVVTEFTGSITNSGQNYTEGSYTGIELSGGSGNGCLVNFEIPGIEGTISEGSGYIPGQYNDISLLGGSGTGAIADISITGTATVPGTVVGGSSYTSGFYGPVELLNTPTTTYTLSTTSNPSPPPNNLYVVDGNTQQSLTLVKGNTYRFDTSDPSNSGHPLSFRKLSGDPLSSNYVVVTKGTAGDPGSFVDLIIKPSAQTETIEYYCLNHSGMGSSISVVDGSLGHYGSGLTANIIVSFDYVDTVTVTFAGSGYKQGDVLTVYTPDVGGSGSGFSYTLGQPTYEGVVTSVTISNNGQNYQQGDILTINSADVGGVGSGFSFEITSDPGQVGSLIFTDKGSGYLPNDVLELPIEVTGVSTTLKGSISGISATLTSGSSVIQVSSTSNIVEGMLVSGNLGDVGTLPANSPSVVSIDSSTQITISENAVTSGSATLDFSSPFPRDTIQVTSTSGIYPQFIATVTSGNGQLQQNTTVVSVDRDLNEITLSVDPLTPGDAVLSFTPTFGQGTTPFEYTIDNIGVVDSFSVTSGGNGYSELDQLSVNPTDLVQPIQYNVKNVNLQTISFVSTLPDSSFSEGDLVEKTGGNLSSFSQNSAPDIIPTTIGPLSTNLSTSSPQITVASTTGITAGMLVAQDLNLDFGVLSPSTTVLSVDSSTEITLSANPTTSGSAGLTFSSDESGTYTSVSSTTNGNGSGATFEVERSTSGSVTNLTIVNAGYFYEVGDLITISGSLVGGSSPSHDIVLEVSGIISSDELTVYKVRTSAGNIVSIDVEANSIVSGDSLIISGTISPLYTVDVASDSRFSFSIDTGSGYTTNPSLILYSGNTYEFDISDSSMSSHIFSLSKYPGGIWGRSFIENVSTTFDTASDQITVASTTSILPGMSIEILAGSTGTLVTGTVVESVIDSTTLKLSAAPLTSGNASLNFRGVEYTDGVVRTSNILSVKISDSTPDLYYYCAVNDENHSDEGGLENEEVLLSIDINNPKTFGSGFLLSAAEITSSNSFTADVETGEVEAVSCVIGEGTFSNVTCSTSITAPTINGTNVNASTITSTSTLSLSGTTINTSGNINVGSNLQIQDSSGNITTSGVVKTTNSVNVNDALVITNNNIASTSGNNILLTPATGRVTKVNTNTALTIPAGSTNERPSVGIVENGSIRYNTDTGQYEGYSASTASWSSLGGVRDLDGNTYIAAEASIGANDNTLYFFNDGNNTVSVTPNYLQFVNVKKIRSINTTAPAYTEYATNTQVTAGDYVKYRNNIYEVTQSGQTGTSGNEPTHTSGAALNGTAELTWSTTAVAPIIFEETEEVRIDPLGFTDLVVNDELRFSNNVISTDLSDLIVRPNTGKKVTIDTNTSLVVPVGDSNQRGVATQGSIRFNTTTFTYEGYDGTNWGSLGGVKDVDQNTYIIPELSPGSNENVLFFYNNGTNTIQLTESSLEFTNIDSITSVNNNLDIEAQTVTFNNLAATIDTSGTSTFIHTTKDNLDLGLAVGLNVDPLLRLDINGDIYVNKAFGTGSFDGLKLINSSFDTFELSDLRIDTKDIQLIKGGTNSGAAVLYDPTVDTGSRVTVSVHNQTTGDKEMIEYHVTDKGSDIFHSDISNLITGVNLVTPVFDFDAGNNVRVTFTLTDLTIGDVVNITVVSNTFKK